MNSNKKLLYFNKKINIENDTFEYDNREYVPKNEVEGINNKNLILDSDFYYNSKNSEDSIFRYIDIDINTIKEKILYISFHIITNNPIAISGKSAEMGIYLTTTFSDGTSTKEKYIHSITNNEVVDVLANTTVSFSSSKTITSAYITAFVSNVLSGSCKVGRPKLEFDRLTEWCPNEKDIINKFDLINNMSSTPLVSSSNNGLMTPAHFNKLDNLTVSSPYEATTADRGYMSSTDKINLESLNMKPNNNIAYGTYTSDINPTISSYTKYKVDINELANNIDKNYYISCNYSGTASSITSSKYIYLYLKVTFANGNTYTKASANSGPLTAVSTQVSGIIQTTGKITSTDITNYGNITDAYVYAYSTTTYMDFLTISNMKVEFGGYTTWCPSESDMNDLYNFIEPYTKIHRNYILDSTYTYSTIGTASPYFRISADLNQFKGKDLYLSADFYCNGTVTASSYQLVDFAIVFTDGTSIPSNYSLKITPTASYNSRDYIKISNFCKGYESKTIKTEACYIYLYNYGITGSCYIKNPKLELYGPTDWCLAVEDNGKTQTINTASSTVLGGVKVGSGLSISNGVLSGNNTQIVKGSNYGYIITESKMVIQWAIVNSVPSNYTWIFPMKNTTTVWATVSMHLSSASLNWCLSADEMGPGNYSSGITASDATFHFTGTVFRAFFLCIGIGPVSDQDGGIL